jgi:hypothetical protein
MFGSGICVGCLNYGVSFEKYSLKGWMLSVDCFHNPSPFANALTKNVAPFDLTTL